MKPMFRSAAAALALSMTAAFSSPALSQDTSSQQATTPATTQTAPQPKKFVILPLAHILSTCTSNGHEFLIVMVPMVHDTILAQGQTDPSSAHLIDPKNFVDGLEKALSDVIIKYSNTDLSTDNTAMAEASSVLHRYTADFNNKNPTFFRAKILHYTVTTAPEPRACNVPAP